MAFLSSCIRSHRQISLLVSLISLSVLLFNLSQVEFSSQSRGLSIALKKGGCFVLPAQAVEPDSGVVPIFAASFPGSGARMTWNIIEALTGLVTGNDYNSNGRGKEVVSVKTHWPHPASRYLDWADEVDRAFLLFRNPMNAIPSYHNFIYEAENKIPHHTKRAPTSVWEHWRNNNFKIQLKYWKEHFEFWLDNYPPDKRIVVPYEHLIDEFQGPAVTQELNAFLGEGPGVNPIVNESVPCVWGTVVQYQKGNLVPNTRYRLPKNMTFVGSYPIWPSSHRKGPKDRFYKKENYDQMISVIEDLEQKYHSEGGRLVAALELYINDIQEAAIRAAEHEEENIKKDRKDNGEKSAKEESKSKDSKKKSESSKKKDEKSMKDTHSKDIDDVKENGVTEKK